MKTVETIVTKTVTRTVTKTVTALDLISFEDILNAESVDELMSHPDVVKWDDEAREGLRVFATEMRARRDAAELEDAATTKDEHPEDARDYLLLSEVLAAPSVDDVMARPEALGWPDEEKPGLRDMIVRLRAYHGVDEGQPGYPVIKRQTSRIVDDIPY